MKNKVAEMKKTEDAKRASIVGDFVAPTEVSSENVAKIREQIMKYK